MAKNKKKDSDQLVANLKHKLKKVRKKLKKATKGPKGKKK